MRRKSSGAIRLISMILSIAMVLCLTSCKKEETGNVDSRDNFVDTPPVVDGYPNPPLYATDIRTGDINVSFRATDKYFYKHDGQQYKLCYLKGVNMGLTMPETSLDNPNVKYDTYMEWFSKITEMNANTVKIFTIMNPDFYRAFADYNKNNQSKPLYLLQGIWFNEDYLYSIGNAFAEDEKIIKAFKKAVYETLDVIHGNSSYTVYGQWNPADYNTDVSKYVAGYILGLEWPSEFVTATNENNSEKSAFKGKYLTTTDKSTAMEAFLCQMGDYLIDFETTNYAHQTPVAFLNWSTTDPLEHTNEPFDEEDAVSVDTENIKANTGYFAGQFAAIDLYPYYPEFLNYQPEYLEYIDPTTGKQNPYRAYLKELVAHYSVPVLVAEFGLPTSRGIAHKSVSGYNQGGITESQQGEYIGELIDSIAKENYAGAMIFSWQDEWFKQTWNTIKYSPDIPSLRTPNAASAEQSYGILSFDGDAASYSDGDFSEWNIDTAIAQTDEFTLYSRYDEAALYLYAKPNQTYNFSSDTIYIPIKTLGVGSTVANSLGVSFNDNTDFLLCISGKDNTRLLCDAYYDVFHYTWAVQKGVFEANKSYSTKGSGVYNRINTFLSNEIVLPLNNQIIEPKYYETGFLNFGDNNPRSPDYNNLADFCGNDNGVEIRLPWSLIGVLNAAQKTTIGDFYKTNRVMFTNIKGIKCGIGKSGKITLADAGYSGISKITYTPRLKKSYDILKNKLSGFMER